MMISGERMREVFPRVFVGNQLSCRSGTTEMAVVHACKSPCHQRAVGYSGSLAREHPEYLALEDGANLWLNMIDPPLPLFQREVFHRFLAFAALHHDRGGSVLIHCNQGESRSPSLALLLLARHLRQLPDVSFAAACHAYQAVDAAYRPGVGIARFLTEEWNGLGCVCRRCTGEGISESLR